MNEVTIDLIYKRIGEKIIKLFPHIEDISIFYNCNNFVKCLENGEYSEPSSELISKLNRFRNRHLNYQWALPIDIFDSNDSFYQKNKQLDLLSEHNNRLLVLNFKSIESSLQDFICLTFPLEIKFLGLYKSIKNLSTDDKILVGELIHKLCQVELDSIKVEFERQIKIKKYLQIKTEVSTHKSSILAIDYLKSELNNQLSKSLFTEIKFDFSNDLLNKILFNNISLNIVIQNLKEVFEIIQHVENIHESFVFELFHFEMFYENNQINNELNNFHKPSSNKAIELLDKLELAAQRVELNGILVTGKSVSQYLVPPVSPPAVTDIIKKNIKRIEVCLNENPSKWTLIRKYLKPLRELEFKNQINNSVRVG